MKQSMSKYILTSGIFFLIASHTIAQSRDTAGHLRFSAVIEIAETKGGKYFQREEGWNRDVVFDTIAQTWIVTSSKQISDKCDSHMLHTIRSEWRTVIIDDKSAAVVSRKKGKRKQFIQAD
jgi:hypothetical protein